MPDRLHPTVVTFIFATCCVWPAWSHAGELPFRPGERIEMEFRYAGLLAGTGTLRVARAMRGGLPVLQFVADGRSAGRFAELLSFRVRDRTRAYWNPESSCSVGIEKHLREGRARRDQIVRFDSTTGIAHVEDAKIDETQFVVGPCVLDVLSALFVTRMRIAEAETLSVPLFDNGKHYALEVRHLRWATLDLPAPLGPGTPVVVVEPLLAEGTGLFVSKGRLEVWLTADERRIPVRMVAKVPIGSVVATLIAYEAGEIGEAP
jgi:hypothetical protein